MLPKWQVLRSNSLSRSSGRVSKSSVAIVLAIIALASIGAYFLLTMETVTGEIEIPLYNPKAYDYNFILPINISEVGTRITVIWSSFIVLYERGTRSGGWSVPSLMGLITLNEASAYQAGGRESLEMVASAVVDGQPLDTGFLHFNISSGEIVWNDLGLPLDQVYLYPYYDYFPYEGLMSFFAYSLREQGLGWTYTFTEPGEYMLVHRYPTDDARLRAVLRNASDEYDPHMVTIAVVYLQAPGGPRTVYRRFQLNTLMFPVASWADDTMSYCLDNQSMVVTGAGDVTISWEASASISLWLRPETTEYQAEPVHDTQGSVTCYLQPDTYYVVFYAPLKDLLDGGYIKYSLAFPRQGAWVWQGTYSEERWRGTNVTEIIWSNEEILGQQGVRVQA